MTTPPRPDQEIDPPAQVIAPGGNAGIFRGRLIIVNGVAAPPGSGIFIYDNVGDLIGSWVGAAGTDPVDGNAVPLSLTVYGPGIQANLQSGNLTIEKLTGLLAPPTIKVLDDTISAGTASNTNISAAQIITPTVFAVAPGDNTCGAETWHTFTGSSGITSSTALRYRLTDQNEVQIDVQLVNSNVNVTLGTLPAAYRPLVNRNAPIAVASGGTSDDRLAITAATGVCTLGGMGSTGVSIGVNVRIPLD